MRSIVGKILIVVYLVVGIVVASSHHYFSHLGGISPSCRRSWPSCCGRWCCSASNFTSGRPRALAHRAAVALVRAFARLEARRSVPRHPPSSGAAVADPRPAYVRSMASPNGLPSVSRRTLHRSPGWMTSPPSSRTRFSAASMSGTEKYGSDTRSPGPVPLGWRPTAEPPPWVCQLHLHLRGGPRAPRPRLRSRTAEPGLGNSTSRSGEVTSPRYASPGAASPST